MLRERRKGSDRDPNPQQQGVSSPSAAAAGGYSGYAGYGGYSSPQNGAGGGYGASTSPPQQAVQPQRAQPQYGGYPQTSASSNLGVSYGGVGVGGGGGTSTVGGGGGYPQYGYGGGAGHSSHGSLASGDETKNRRKPSTAGGLSAIWSNITIVLAMTTFCFFGATLHFHSRYKHATTHHATSHDARTKAEAELEGKTKHIKFLEDRVAEMTKVHSELKADVAYHKDQEQSMEERAKTREEILKGRMSNMMMRVARESHRATLDKFGGGPHQVAFQVKLPVDRTNYPTVPTNPTILINLYTDDMPHATHLFLEQIAHGLWNGCSFVINADHVFQAGAHHVASGENTMKKFVEKELDILSFQEYSPEHPHAQYTVGFAGRPAGPDFYINKHDNSDVNGPGGQDHHDLNEEADPCFGAVDDASIKVVERLFALPNAEENGENDHLLAEPLHILNARIIGWADPIQARQAANRIQQQNAAAAKKKLADEAAAKKKLADEAAAKKKLADEAAAKRKKQEEGNKNKNADNKNADEKKKINDAMKKAEAGK